MADTVKPAVNNREGDREIINGVEFTHHFKQAGGLNWHYVEAGKPGSEAIVYLHGLPESWFSWHYQMEGLAGEYRSIALDMKAFGQTEKPDDSYRVDYIAGQVSALLSAIKLDRYNLVTHDWGTMVGDPLAELDHAKIIRYLRMEGWVLVQDTTNVPHALMFRNDQKLASTLMADAAGFVSRVYQNNIVQPIPEADMERIISEFARAGIAQAVPRYFRDIDIEMTSEEGLKKRRERFAGMTFPVLLLQADADPFQPARIFENAAAAFPNAVLWWVKDCGHFSELEQPQQVTAAMREFMQKTAPGNRL